MTAFTLRCPQLTAIHLVKDGNFSANVARPSKQHKMKRQLSDWAKETARLEHKNSAIC